MSTPAAGESARRPAAWRLLAAVIGVTLVVATVAAATFSRRRPAPPSASSTRRASALERQGTAPGSGAAPAAAVSGRARSVTVRLLSRAPSCGREISASGFAYAPERVMTAAHAVAGSTGTITVSTAAGKRYEARVVLFDPAHDVAVLRVPRLKPQPSVFSSARAGEQVTFAGFLKGGELTSSPSAVQDVTQTVSLDIYQRARATRRIYVLRGVVKPGVSGGPVLRADGTITGMVFAASLDDPQRAFALSAAEITRPMVDGIGATSPVSTKTCAR